jgi:hypothetical protein
MARLANEALLAFMRLLIHPRSSRVCATIAQDMWLQQLKRSIARDERLQAALTAIKKNKDAEVVAARLTIANEEADALIADVRSEHKHTQPFFEASLSRFLSIRVYEKKKRHAKVVFSDVIFHFRVYENRPSFAFAKTRLGRKGPIKRNKTKKLNLIQL